MFFFFLYFFKDWLWSPLPILKILEVMSLLVISRVFAYMLSLYMEAEKRTFSFQLIIVCADPIFFFLEMFQTNVRSVSQNGIFYLISQIVMVVIDGTVSCLSASD